ncbi:MAG: hypothetical protein WBC70_01320 [Candidatus Aminicenantales bacterium]
MNKRTFTWQEITKILGSQIRDPDLDVSIDLGGGLRAVISASVYRSLKKGQKPDYKFFLEADGQEPRELEKATPEELEKISAFLWTNAAPQFGMSDREKREAELMPENLKGEDDEDVILPDDLRESTDPARRVLDDLLTPSRLVDIEQNPGRARKLAQEKGTLDDLLTPDELVDGVEDESLEGQLTPDNLREEKKT